jgi:hypothetical protein
MLRTVLSTPQRLTLQANQDPMLLEDNAPWPLVISLAALVYAVPLILMRRHTNLLFWWLWMACGVGLVVGIDLLRHSTLLAFTRYAIPAAPGVYALLAMPLGGKMGRMVPWVILGGVVIFGVDYTQAGPPNAPDAKIISKMIRSEVAPGDVVIVTGDYYFAGDLAPPLTYFVIAHYGGPWRTPVVFATGKISEAVQQELLRYHRIWVVGITPASDTAKILPGWKVLDVHGPGDSNLLWYVTPPARGKS